MTTTQIFTRSRMYHTHLYSISPCTQKLYFSNFDLIFPGYWKSQLTPDKGVLHSLKLSGILGFWAFARAPPASVSTVSTACQLASSPVPKQHQLHTAASTQWRLQRASWDECTDHFFIWALIRLASLVCYHPAAISRVFSTNGWFQAATHALNEFVPLNVVMQKYQAY